MAGRRASAVKKAAAPSSGETEKIPMEKFLATFEKRQMQALREKAEQLRPDLKARPDVSALIREAVDEWLRRHVK